MLKNIIIAVMVFLLVLAVLKTFTDKTERDTFSSLFVMALCIFLIAFLWTR